MMWSKIILISLFLNILAIENRMIPIYYETEAPVTEQDVINIGNLSSDENADENMSRTFANDNHNRLKDEANDKEKKPCAIVVLSNIQNPTMQSLLRKYRYDANGVLIPSSVKYFIKLPQGLKSSSILVPLNDKAFSPLGGFVRYYKEVPPIPHAW